MGQETTSIHRPWRPERTDPHLAVRENLERLLDRHGPLTDRSRRTLKEDLRCGILAAGSPGSAAATAATSNWWPSPANSTASAPPAGRSGPRSSAALSSTRSSSRWATASWSSCCPDSLRRPFYCDRRLLTDLCRSAVEATHAFYRAGLGTEITIVTHHDMVKRLPGPKAVTVMIGTTTNSWLASRVRMNTADHAGNPQPGGKTTVGNGPSEDTGGS